MSFWKKILASSNKIDVNDDVNKLAKTYIATITDAINNADGNPESVYSAYKNPDGAYKMFGTLNVKTPKDYHEGFIRKRPTVNFNSINVSLSKNDLVTYGEYTFTFPEGNKINALYVLVLDKGTGKIKHHHSADKNSAHNKGLNVRFTKSTQPTKKEYETKMATQSGTCVRTTRFGELELTDMTPTS